MPGLTIPEQFRAAVARVGTITEEQFFQLAEALQRPLTADTAEILTERIAEEVPSLPNLELRDVVAALASMQGVQRSAHVEISRFAADLWDSLVEEGEEAVGVDEEIFKARIIPLLSNSSIHLTSVKVAELRREIERMFCSARVLTDLRTVFGYDAKKKPALTLMHTLEIRYHDDTGRLREFYVAVDDTDLTELREAIDRAFEKRATIVDALEKADFDLYK